MEGKQVEYEKSRLFFFLFVQKNPNTVRTPEEDIGRENATFDYVIDLRKLNVISSHIRPLCREGVAYTQESDLKFWAALGNPSEAFLVLDAVQHLPVMSGQTPTGRCKDQGLATDSYCLCHLNFCVPWYPCGLKFCRGHDVSGKILSYRCGIKTCKKCLHYQFVATKKDFCRCDD